jgi:hypothetical protein
MRPQRIRFIPQLRADYEREPKYDGHRATNGFPDVQTCAFSQQEDAQQDGDQDVAAEHWRKPRDMQAERRQSAAPGRA